MGDASILYQQEQQKDLATAKKNDDRNPAGTGIAVPTDGNVTRRLRIDASPQNRASDENPQAGTGDQGGKPASNADHMRHERFEPRSEFERKMQTQEAKASWSPIFDPNFSRAIGYQRQSYGFSEVHDVSGNFVGTSQAFEGQNPDFAKLKGELARRNLPEPRTDYERDLQQGKYGRAWEPVFAQNIKDSPIGYQFSSATITYFDISGRFVGSSSGEKPLEPPALDPIDFVPTEAIGTLAAKGGTFIFKEMAQAVGRAIGKEGVEEAEKIGFSAAMKSASEKLGTFGKALVEDEA